MFSTDVTAAFLVTGGGLDGQRGFSIGHMADGFFLNNAASGRDSAAEIAQIDVVLRDAWICL